jgi:tRNA (guanine37-N1)-methyltransferase
MQWTLLTLFPGAFDSILATSLFGKAIGEGRVQVSVKDIRDHAEDRHRVVDDVPFGGGPGMVMKAEPMAKAIESVRAEDPNVHVVLMSPQGSLLNQEKALHLSKMPHVALVCGRYEGVDERVKSVVDEELSIGDFVLAGGEPAAWVVMDAVSRLLPGVLGREESLVEESFGEDGLLEYPQYTRPQVFRGMEVPKVLVSGNHAAIADWRRKQSLIRTAKRRPDLLERAKMTEEERTWVKEELSKSTLASGHKGP